MNKQNRRRFCTRPFEWFEISSGKAYGCCPGWITLNGVDIKGKSVKEIWNHPEFQEFRSSVFDGSFRYCDFNECPFLNQENVPHWEPEASPVKYIDEITNPRYRFIAEGNLLDSYDGPYVWNCSYDRTCNLSCPSCRNSLFGLKKHEVKKKLKFQTRILDEIGKQLKVLYVTGSGDPFASSVFQKMLMDLTSQDYPDLEIHLHTNGILWTPFNWDKLKKINNQITSAHVSMDAASSGTYKINRRGGDWNTLMKNLEFIAQLRRKGPLQFVMLSFVVQQNNYHEMPAFVKLAEAFGFDVAQFSKIRNWGTYSASEFKEVAVHYPTHPQYYQLLKVLCDPVFDNPTAGLCTLNTLRRKALELSSK